MAVIGINNYTDYYADTKKKNVSEATEKTADQQKAEKSYSNSREYKDYLYEKYDCMTSSDYSVVINSSFLSEAAGDEKKAEWLEYNLSLIPETVEKTKKMAEARGSQILSYNITINGYDNMKAELCTKAEADPGTEKASKELKERIEKKREERKAEEKKKEEKAAENAAEKERQYNIMIAGKDVKEVTKKSVDMILSSKSEASTGGNRSTFDVMA